MVQGFALRVPAKINLILHVGDRRADGYHPIFSLMQQVALFDRLGFARSPRDVTLSVVGAPLSAGPDNLVLRAARALRAECGRASRAGARLTLEKYIPIAAGLGGGSGDAAAALVGLNRLWGLDLSRGDLAVVARGLGSDVPFFLGGPTAWVEGVGEHVTTTGLDGPHWAVLVNPGIAVATAWTYRELDRRRARDRSSLELTSSRILNTINSVAKPVIPLARLIPLLHNDLEPIASATHSVVGVIRHRLMKAGAVASMMSGSGPTVFGLFTDARSARNAVGQLRRCEPSWGVWPARLLRRAVF